MNYVVRIGFAYRTVLVFKILLFIPACSPGKNSQSANKQVEQQDNSGCHTLSDGSPLRKELRAYPDGYLDFLQWLLSNIVEPESKDYGVPGIDLTKIRGLHLDALRVTLKQTVREFSTLGVVFESELLEWKKARMLPLRPEDIDNYRLYRCLEGIQLLPQHFEVSSPEGKPIFKSLSSHTARRELIRFWAHPPAIRSADQVTKEGFVWKPFESMIGKSGSHLAASWMKDANAPNLVSLNLIAQAQLLRNSIREHERLLLEQGADATYAHRYAFFLMVATRATIGQRLRDSETNNQLNRTVREFAQVWGRDLPLFFTSEPIQLVSSGKKEAAPYWKTEILPSSPQAFTEWACNPSNVNPELLRRLNFIDCSSCRGSAHRG